MATTEIVLDLIDVSAKSKSSLSVDNINSVSNLNNLKQNVEIIKYATLEKNTFPLDGQEHIYDDDVNTGYCSEQVSDENAEFLAPIHLTITFQDYHTSAGITLIFGKNGYCNNLNIKYYSDNELLYDGDYNPTDRIAYLESNSIENYNKIELTFYSTNIPYRFLKIDEIIYGLIKTFSETELANANTNHSIDMLSSELEVNTLNFTVVDEEDKFNIVNPLGYVKDMQDNQKAAVFEVLNSGIKKFIGNFYLKKWSNTSGSQAKFEAQDLIGVLDNYTFNGGIYTNKNAATLISEIFAVADVENYVIDESIDGSIISGLIKVCTCREALQKVLFTIGAVCNTYGEEVCRIYKPQSGIVDSFIEDDRKLLDSTNVELNEKITAIEFNMYSYVLGDERSEVSSGTLDGTNKIEFSEPISPNSAIATNCTIKEIGNNYAIIESSSEHEYKIEALTYTEIKTVKTIERLVKENLKENIVTVDDIQLLNPDNLNSIADRLFNYYNATYKTEVKVLGGEEKTGSLISVNTFNNYKLIGNVSNIATDLIGGFITTLAIDKAILKQGTNEYYHCGDANFYSGFEGIREV